jgi:hypothetical protein
MMPILFRQARNLHCELRHGAPLAERGVRFIQLYHRAWDHHPSCFTIWMAGGGIKPVISIGENDDFSCNAAVEPVHVHDLNATILHTLGVDHTKALA